MCIAHGVRWLITRTFCKCSLMDRRENTVLRGQLFEQSEEDPTTLELRKSVYVIPNTLVAEQFKPCAQPPSDTSESM